MICPGLKLSRGSNTGAVVASGSSFRTGVALWCFVVLSIAAATGRRLACSSAQARRLWKTTSGLGSGSHWRLLQNVQMTCLGMSSSTTTIIVGTQLFAPATTLRLRCRPRTWAWSLASPASSYTTKPPADGTAEGLTASAAFRPGAPRHLLGQTRNLSSKSVRKRPMLRSVRTVLAASVFARAALHSTWRTSGAESADRQHFLRFRWRRQPRLVRKISIFELLDDLKAISRVAFSRLGGALYHRSAAKSGRSKRVARRARRTDATQRKLGSFPSVRYSTSSDSLFSQDGISHLLWCAD